MSAARTLLSQVIVEGTGNHGVTVGDLRAALALCTGVPDDVPVRSLKDDRRDYTGLLGLRIVYEVPDVGHG